MGSSGWGRRLLTVYRDPGAVRLLQGGLYRAPRTGTPWFLEINTLPGMTPTSLVPQEAAAIGLDYAGLCQRIIDESLKARNG